MALKVLSGLILPTEGNRQSGTATIDFSPHAVSGDTAQPDPNDMASMGPEGPFVNEPQKIISLREIRTRHYDTDTIGGGHGESVKTMWDINDKYLDTGDTEGIKVSWETKGETEIHEISYMFIEEAVNE